MNCKLLLPVAAASLLLAGCAHKPFNEAEYSYNPNHSRAWNLCTMMNNGYYWDVSDVKAPKEYSGGADGSIALSSFGWAGGFHSAAGSGFLPGTTNWGLGLGIGLGLSLLQSALTPPDPEERNWLVTYLPADKAGTAVEAQKAFLKSWTDAFAKSARAAYPDSDLKIEEVHGQNGKIIKVLYFVDHNIGCYGWKELKDMKEYGLAKRCQIEFAAYPALGYGTVESVPMLNLQKPSWRMRSAYFSFIGGDDQNIDFLKIITNANKDFPDYSYVYLTTRRNPDGNKNPPMVLEKDKVNFFIRPSSVNTK